MPSENHAFTTHVDPVSPPSSAPGSESPGERGMVEAPGTAPGSVTLIPQGVYRHSRFPGTLNISIPGGFGKVHAAPEALNPLGILGF